MIKKKKIFISGIAGFLGSHLAESFILEGFEVAGCDNLIGGYLDNVPAKAEFHQCDVTSFDTMVKIMKGSDIIYHCAATAYEGLSVFSPNFITKNIVQASVSIVTAAIVNKAERFIYCSSMARYGNQDILPFTENMIPNPCDPYGIGKLSAEMLIKNLCTTHNLDYVIAVPHNIIGPKQKYDDPYRNVASIMINLMLSGKQPMIYGDGNQKRCFSFIDDDIEILQKLAFADNVLGEIINIGPDGEFITINELSKQIAELLDFDLKPIYMKKRPQEVYLANCSADKARNLLDYNPQTSLKIGLKSIIEYIKNRGVREFKYHIDLEIVNEKAPKTWTDKLF